MNTNCKRLMHVTFAIGVLVLAVSASTSATAAPTARSQELERHTVRLIEPAVAQTAPTVRSRAGEYTSWILNRRGVVAFILGCAATAPVKSVLPAGVVVDDGVPF